MVAALAAILTRVARAPVRRRLAQWYDRHDAVDLLDRAMAIANDEDATPPSRSTVGGELMVHSARLTRGLYMALIEHGASETEAQARTAAATWAVYRQMGSVPALVAWGVGLLFRHPATRPRVATTLFRIFPFGPPSYEMTDVPVGPDTVAFNVERCPVAAYFRDAELAPLCKAAWCDLDFQLAPMWGATLVRTTTLAEGHDQCDFRWNVTVSVEEEP